MGDRDHNRHGPKRGGGLLCPISRGAGTCGLGRGLLPYQVASSSIQAFGRNRHGPKLGEECAFFMGRAGFLLNTKSPRPRPTSIFGGMLASVKSVNTKWHLSPCSRLATADIGRKLGGCAPLVEGEGAGFHLTHCRVGQGLPTYQVAS